MQGISVFLLGLCFCTRIESAADRAFGAQRQGPRAFFGAKGPFGPLWGWGGASRRLQNPSGPKLIPWGFCHKKKVAYPIWITFPKGPLGVALRTAFSWPTPGTQGSGRKFEFAGGARNLEGWAPRFEGWAPRI